MKHIISQLLCFSTLFFNVQAQTQQKPLEIKHLTGDFYIYTTWQDYNGFSVPSNSMYLVTDKGVVMMDTPWDSTQFQPLIDSIETRHQQKVVMSISTHSHGDRTAGVEFLKSKGVKTYASKQTYDLCKVNDEKQPEFYFEDDTTFQIGEYRFQTFYPGSGHTIDNIVVWFESDKILYGGCFIRSPEVRDLGYTGEAKIADWKNSIINTKTKFPSARYVIPGHYDWKNKKGLEHTLKLMNKALKKKSK